MVQHMEEPVDNYSITERSGTPPANDLPTAPLDGETAGLTAQENRGSPLKTRELTILWEEPTVSRELEKEIDCKKKKNKRRETCWKTRRITRSEITFH